MPLPLLLVLCCHCCGRHSACATKCLHACCCSDKINVTDRHCSSFYRDLREGLRQASKAAEKHHTEQPAPDQQQLLSNFSQQDCLPSITLCVSPRRSQQSSQGICAADNSNLIGLPLLRATSPPQLVCLSAAADRITAGASQPALQGASALGQQDSDMPLAGAYPSMAQAMTCAQDQRGHKLHDNEGEQSTE